MDDHKEKEASNFQPSPAAASDDSEAAAEENWPAIPSLAGGKEHEIIPSENESDVERLPEGGVHSQLDEFRQQWQNELQKKPGSRSESPRESGENYDTPEPPMDDEAKAKALFLQGMDAEDNGSLSLAIYYYKKALQIVPDIESKISAEFMKAPRERERMESESSVEGGEAEEDLLQSLDNLKLQEEGLCQPAYEQRAMHISGLPIELMHLILRWVITSDLDLRSLEMVSMVCKGLYLCARDEGIWKAACHKVWGSQLGSTKKFGHSYRRMMLERPRLLYDGCYISKITYVRQGEQGMDQFYRPFHLVEYYRYMRFFPDGKVLMLVSPDEPSASLSRLRHRSAKVPGMLRGHYKLSDSKVTCVLKRVKAAENVSYRYKRQRNAANQADQTEQTYTVELDINPQGRRSHAKLTWTQYTVCNLHKASGEESVSSFDLTPQAFPPLIFSRVRSFLAQASQPLA